MPKESPVSLQTHIAAARRRMQASGSSTIGNAIESIRNRREPKCGLAVFLARTLDEVARASMKHIYHRLLFVIAGSTQRELASQIRYLKTEDETLPLEAAQASAGDREGVKQAGEITVKVWREAERVGAILHPTKNKSRKIATR